MNIHNKLISMAKSLVSASSRHSQAHQDLLSARDNLHIHVAEVERDSSALDLYYERLQANKAEKASIDSLAGMPDDWEYRHTEAHVQEYGTKFGSK